MRAPAANSERYELLDLCRGVLAIWVAISHFHIFSVYVGGSNDHYPWKVLQTLTSHASVAVDLFWIISGVALSAVYGQTTIPKSEFLKRRFIRIYPLHLLTLFVILSVEIVYNSKYHLIFAPRDTSLNIFLNFFLVSEWVPNHRSYNNVIWSVSAEIAIYFVFAFFYKKLFVAQGALIFLLIIVFTFLEFAFPHYYIFKCGKFFFGGVVLQLILTRKYYSGMVLLLILIYLFKTYEVKYLLFTSLLISIFLLMKLSPQGKSSLSNLMKLCSLSANLSYGIYLLQLPLIFFTILCFRFFNVESLNIVGSWLYLSIYLIFLVALAYVVFNYFEKPVGIYLKTKLIS